MDFAITNVDPAWARCFLITILFSVCNLFFWSDLLTLVNSPYTDRCVNFHLCYSLLSCSTCSTTSKKTECSRALELKKFLKGAHAKPKLFAVGSKFTTLLFYIRAQDSLNGITIPISRDTPIIFSFPLDYNGQRFFFIYLYIFMCALGTKNNHMFYIEPS